jgi:hypothetical protein
MRLNDWIDGVYQRHTLHKQGLLSEEAQTLYRRDREDFALSGLLLQRLALAPGQRPRRALRIRRALPVELQSSDGSLKSLTADLSPFGFAALLDGATVWTAPVAFRIELPGGLLAAGQARAVSTRWAAGGRGGFSISEISDEHREALANTVFDEIFATLRLE